VCTEPLPLIVVLRGKWFEAPSNILSTLYLIQYGRDNPASALYHAKGKLLSLFTPLLTPWWGSVRLLSFHVPYRLQVIQARKISQAAGGRLFTVNIILVTFRLVQRPRSKGLLKSVHDTTIICTAHSI